MFACQTMSNAQCASVWWVWLIYSGQGPARMTKLGHPLNFFQNVKNVEILQVLKN
jgi:hypothetical protein